MKTKAIDPIIAEVRAVRDKHASKFGYDLEKIFRDIKARHRRLQVENLSGTPHDLFSNGGLFSVKKSITI